MTGLWAAALLVLNVFNAERQPWIGPVPGVRMERSRPVRRERDFAADSAYALLLRAGELPPEVDVPWIRDRLLGRFRAHRLPADPPETATDAQPWTVADRDRLASMLQAALPNLELGRRAALTPDGRVPTPLSLDGDCQYLGAGRKMAFALVASAYHMESQGDAEGALRELLVSIRCGNILARGGPHLGYMMDMAISRDACQALWCVASRNSLPAPVLRQSARELLVLADSVEPLAEAMRECARMDGLLVDRMYRTGRMDQMGDHQSVKRDLGAWLGLRLASLATGTSRVGMRRDLDCLYQHLVALAQQPYHHATEERLNKLLPGSGAAGYRTRNAAALEIARMLVPVYRRSFLNAAERDAALRGTALFLAIRAYADEKGKPPASLAMLVPDYLPRLPVDPFDGAPFRYRVGAVPERWGDSPWGLHSIGADFSDDRGKARECVGTHARNPDMVWTPRPLPPFVPDAPAGPARGFFDLGEE